MAKKKQTTRKQNNKGNSSSHKNTAPKAAPIRRGQPTFISKSAINRQVKESREYEKTLPTSYTNVPKSDFHPTI